MKFRLILLVLTAFLISCSPEPQITPEDTTPLRSAPQPQPLPEQSSPEINITDKETPEETENPGCQFNSDCLQGTYCINSSCQTLPKPSDVVSQECACRIQTIEIYTSDDETYTFAPGLGSYTAGGALEWKILSVPAFCEDNLPAIPLKIMSKNYNKVYRDDVILLKEGETSSIIHHPLMPEVEFTLKVIKVKAQCQRKN